MELTNLPLFDYASLDTETRIVVQRRTDEIKTLMRRTAQDIIEIGQKLIDVKLRLGHGNFGPWLRAEFDWTATTAWQFMKVAEKFSNFESLSNFAPSALYLLAAPSTPESARVEAIQRAQSGEKITHSTSREIVSQHKPASVKPPQVRYTAAEEPPPVDDLPPIDYSQTDEEAGEIFDGESEPIPATPIVHRAYKNSSESNEWYTPANLIQKATSLLGVINLDPASSELANQTVQARRIYTIEDDGLTRQWVGNVWCNPPYGDDVARFVEKMIAEYEAGHILEGLLLVAARTDTQWFRKLRRFPRCFLWGRVKFIKSETGQESDPAGFPSMIVYFGSHPDNFAEVFDSVGDIYALWGST